jgi:nucleoid-associated protein YgaU
VSPQASQGPVIKTISQTLVGSGLPVVKEIAPIKIIQEPGTQSTQASSAETKKQTAEKAVVSKPRKHIVQQGENLRSIAQKYYNDSDKWKLIYKANKDKIISGQVNPGQEITIP